MDNRYIDYYYSRRSDSRTIRAKRDDAAGVLLSRSERMDAEKKALLKVILDQGGTFGQVARLSGEHASTVSRRFRTMVQRLRGQIRCANDDAAAVLTPLERTILIESFLYGTSQKQIAAKLGVSRYRVRKALYPFQNSNA